MESNLEWSLIFDFPKEIIEIIFSYVDDFVILVLKYEQMNAKLYKMNNSFSLLDQIQDGMYQWMSDIVNIEMKNRNFRQKICKRGKSVPSIYESLLMFDILNRKHANKLQSSVEKLMMFGSGENESKTMNVCHHCLTPLVCCCKKITNHFMTSFLEYDNMRTMLSRCKYHKILIL